MYLPQVQRRVDDWIYANEDLCSQPVDQDKVLVWVDTETSGLETDSALLEIAIMVTDLDGYMVQSFNSVVAYKYKLNCWDSKVINMHTGNLLLSDIEYYWPLLEDRSYKAVAERIEAAFSWLTKPQPMSGSTVEFDAKFMKKYLPSVYSRFFTYRTINVSSLKELAVRLMPEEVEKGNPYWEPIKAHRALPDIIDSIEEYRWYRRFLINPEA